MDGRERASQMRRRVAQSAQKCEHCGHPYAPENVTVLGREADVWFLALRCRRCRGRVYAAATFRERRVQRPQRGDVATNMTTQPSITADDVRAVQSFLSGFDGDFQKLFRPS